MEKPLRGAVLCCTSILPEQRATIAEIAKQMGAEHKLDLTSDVTHLIVGGVDTPKYRYVAREREDVKVLRPEWVEAVRQAWMHAEELDLAALEKQYQLLTFTGLAICLTGFDNCKHWDLDLDAIVSDTTISDLSRPIGRTSQHQWWRISRRSYEKRDASYCLYGGRKEISVRTTMGNQDCEFEMVQG